MGKFAIVDAEDYSFLSRWKWQHSNNGYALRTTNVGGRVKNGGKRVTILMHRLILQPPDGMVVDHINGNKLDNRRENIRISSQSENCQSRRMAKNNTSGFKGVSWGERSKKWLSYITIKGKLKLLGEFKDPISAAIAYNMAARFYFKEYALLNKIHPVYMNNIFFNETGSDKLSYVPMPLK